MTNRYKVVSVIKQPDKPLVSISVINYCHLILILTLYFTTFIVGTNC